MGVANNPCKWALRLEMPKKGIYIYTQAPGGVRIFSQETRAAIKTILMLDDRLHGSF